MPKFISSPAERVQKTLTEAYKSSTDSSVEISELCNYQNTKDQYLEKTKHNVYNNLLWLWWWRAKVEPEYKKVLHDLNEQPENKELSELAIQDKACTLFLQWTFESGNPYTISQERLKLLLKWFDKLDTQKEVKILAMRHWHREGNDLTEFGIQEAQKAGKEYDFSTQDVVIGTHQTIIESILISLVWWSQWLTPQEAWNSLPSVWQNPYRTAQVTEFVFRKNSNGEKTLIIKTNNVIKILTEDQCKRAYENISKWVHTHEE